MSIRVVVGLGNPGPGYQRTRHNLGFRVLDALAQSLQIRWRKRREFLCWLGQGDWEGNRLILVKPATFVNLSGRAVKQVTDYFQVPPREVLLITDDVNLKLGQLRIRARGGPGGHHGLESIIAELKSSDFPRLRLGVGGGEKSDLVPHVLSPGDSEEEKTYQRMVEVALRAVETVIHEGLARAMNKFNPAPGGNDQGRCPDLPGHPGRENNHSKEARF